MTKPRGSHSLVTNQCKNRSVSQAINFNPTLIFKCLQKTKEMQPWVKPDWDDLIRYYLNAGRVGVLLQGFLHCVKYSVHNIHYTLVRFRS